MMHRLREINVSQNMLEKYLSTLIDMFFKILPLRESGEPTLVVYIRSLQMELIGCSSLIEQIHEDGSFISLISILQYLIDNPECDVPSVKREVFRAIRICNTLKAKYATTEPILDREVL